GLSSAVATHDPLRPTPLLRRREVPISGSLLYSCRRQAHPSPNLTSFHRRQDIYTAGDPTEKYPVPFILRGGGDGLRGADAKDTARRESKLSMGGKHARSWLGLGLSLEVAELLGLCRLKDDVLLIDHEISGLRGNDHEVQRHPRRELG